MRKKTYLEPAHRVICKFGPGDGKLSSAIRVVSEITGADPTRVYRWMRPREKGGTDGIIPSKAQMKLFEHAQAQSIPLSASDFFDVAHEAA